MLELEAEVVQVIEFRMGEAAFKKADLGFHPTQRDTFMLREKRWRLRSVELTGDGTVRLQAIREPIDGAA